MVTIAYTGFDPSEITFINSKKFQKFLNDHPELKLATFEDDNTYTAVGPKLKESFRGRIALVDTTNEKLVLWVLYDDVNEIDNPDERFIKALKLMDKYAVKTAGYRLFLPDYEDENQQDFEGSEPELLEAKYSFKTGKFKI